MKRKTAIALIAAMSVAFAAQGVEEKKAETAAAVEPKEQTHCPVMQRSAVDKALWVDVKGKRIYVCCPGCIEKIEANPDKYINRLEAEGVTPDSTP
ncbi:hypothetical protein [Pontiella sp.]|uniref:hypothetical protein n=1 Tax=Pontiella sp. TaxID=2837462 RepID=UPI003564247A